MEHHQAMSNIVAAGLGCRKGCGPQEIVDLVVVAMEKAEVPIDRLSGLFTPAFKHSESGIAEAARTLGLPLVLIPEPLMKAAEPRAITVSERVISLTGLASVAETAALAGAGPHSRLVRPRIASRNATCAIAVSGTVNGSGEPR
jgi:cobalt-precorrin 5A hydrolase